jgi:hypothetical protein
VQDLQRTGASARSRSSLVVPGLFFSRRTQANRRTLDHKHKAPYRALFFSGPSALRHRQVLDSRIPEQKHPDTTT